MIDGREVPYCRDFSKVMVLGQGQYYQAAMPAFRVPKPSIAT